MRTIAAIFLASLLLAMPRAAEAGDARVRFPQGDAYEGAPWLVVIEVVDAQQASPPVAPEIPGAAVRLLERGRQQSTQIINGRVSSSMSVTYAIEIVPEKAGTLQVPALEVTVDGPVDPTTGYVVNLRDVKAVVEREIVDVVDHRNLNLEVPFMAGTIPSTENFVLAIWRVLAPAVAPARLARLKLWETENQYAEYDGR